MKMINKEGMSNIAFILILVILLVIIFLIKTSNFELENVPLLYILIFFFAIVPLITFLWILYFKVKK